MVNGLVTPESPWVGEHRRPSRSLREILGLSNAQLAIIEGFIWLWLLVEAVVIFLPFVY